MTMTKRELELEIELCQLKHELFMVSGRLLEYDILYNRGRASDLQKKYESMKSMTEDAKLDNESSEPASNSG